MAGRAGYRASAEAYGGYSGCRGIRFTARDRDTSMPTDASERRNGLVPPGARRSAEGVVYLSLPGKHEPFEGRYLSLREKEGRLLPDAVVKELPFFLMVKPTQLAR